MNATSKSLGILALACPLLSAPLVLGDSDPIETADADVPLLQSPVPASVIAAPLIRAGLTPEALAACGVSSVDIPTVLMEAVNAWQADPTRLLQADADYSDARRDTDALRRKIQAGKATQEEVADYQSGLQTLAAAEAERDAALAALRQAACAELPAAMAAHLNQIHANRDWEELPIQYRVLDLSEADWVLLRKALLNQKTSAKYEEDPDPALAAHLAQLQADSSVSSAQTGLDANLAPVQAAWDAFLDV